MATTLQARPEPLVRCERGPAALAGLERPLVEPPSRMSPDDRAGTATFAPARAEIRDAPVVIDAERVSKTFRIPHARVDSLKERVTHPFAGRDYRELHALQEISFDVHSGEFFGIAGRNGSGKITLLKIMASIYRADAGRIRMAGRLAPFIELGVGFNPELTSRENVGLNGVLMGLSLREARRRVAPGLAFAGPQGLPDLQPENDPLGYVGRLALSVMGEARADI